MFQHLSSRARCAWLRSAGRRLQGPALTSQQVWSQPSSPCSALAPRSAAVVQSGLLALAVPAGHLCRCGRCPGRVEVALGLQDVLLRGRRAGLHWKLCRTSSLCTSTWLLTIIKVLHSFSGIHKICLSIFPESLEQEAEPPWTPGAFPLTIKIVLPEHLSCPTVSWWQR